MLLITPRLWKTFIHLPIHHALVQHTIKLLTPKPRRGCWRIFEIVVGIIAVLIILALALSFLAQYRDILAGILLLILNPNPIVLAYIPLFGVTIYSAPLNTRATQIIRQKRDEKTYDFLCLLPCGRLVMTWLVCLGCLHFRKTLRNTHRFIRGLLLVMLVIVMLALGVQNADRGFLGLIITFPTSLIFIFALYFDYAQSITMGSMIYLTYMTTDSQTLHSFNLGGLTFFVLQLILYTWAIFLRLSILPSIFFSLSIEGWLADLVQLVVWGFLVLGARELIISVLWRLLSRRFKTDLNELALMTAS